MYCSCKLNWDRTKASANSMWLDDGGVEKKETQMYYWMTICEQSRGPHTEVDIPMYILKPCQVDLEELLV